MIDAGQLPSYQADGFDMDAKAIWYYGPVQFEEDRLGTVFLRADLSNMYHRLNETLLIIAAALGFSLLLAVVTTWKLQSVISKPLGELVETANVITQEKDYSLRARSTIGGEVGELVSGFNEMISEIQQRDSQLQEARDALEMRVEKRTRDLVTANNRLAMAMQDAQQAACSKSEFLANMSHEIRTPMNGVLGMLDLILREKLNETARKYSKIAMDSAKSLLTIIDDILDFSKIEAGKLELEIIDFDLIGMVENVAEINSHPASEKGVQLYTFIDGEVPSRVRGDPGRVRQVLTNIVGNAIKFTDGGEITIRVKVDQELQDGIFLEFSVADTGIGIPADRLDSIFGTFEQADGSTTRKYGGTGLGLAISKKLVDMMGGDISVKSAVGKGTTFLFTVNFENHSEGLPETIRVLEDVAGLRVLVVDDHATNRMILCQYLSRWKCDVVAAEDGEQGLKMLSQAIDRGEPFDVALVDYRMPGMDGLEFAEKVQEDSSLEQTNMVLLTSLGQRGEASKSRDTGFSGYLTKPVRLSELVDCIRMVMGEEQRVGDSKEGPKTGFVTRHQLHEELRDRLRILVVEDNEINRLLVMALLEDTKSWIDIANDGMEAVQAFEPEKYDLILMDCQMPRMSGYEATEEIRKLEMGESHVPIIALTAHVLPEEKEKCIASGMDDYLPKPIDRDALLSKIADWTASGPRKPTEKVNEDDLSHPPSAKTFEYEAVLKRCMGNKELVKKLCLKFAAGTGDDLAELEKAVSEDDSTLAGQIAHRIKGAAANLAAHQVQEHASGIELATRSDDLSHTLEGLPALRTAMDKFKTEVNSIWEPVDAV